MLHLGSYCTQLDHGVKHRDGTQLSHLVALDGKHAPQLLDWLDRPDRGPARADRALDQVRPVSLSSPSRPSPLTLTLTLTLTCSPRRPTQLSSGAPCRKTGPGQTLPPTTSGPSSPSTSVHRPPPVSPSHPPLTLASPPARTAPSQPPDRPAPRPSRRRLCLPKAARRRHVRSPALPSSVAHPVLVSLVAHARSLSSASQCSVPLAHRCARPPNRLGPPLALRCVPRPAQGRRAGASGRHFVESGSVGPSCRPLADWYC